MKLALTDIPVRSGCLRASDTSDNFRLPAAPFDKLGLGFRPSTQNGSQVRLFCSVRMRAALGLKIGRASERGFNHIPLSAGRRVTLSLDEMGADMKKYICAPTCFFLI